jgi:hypothetical protein
MRRSLFALTIMTASLALCGGARADDKVRVGEAAAVTETVTANLGEEAPHVVVLGEDVFFSERVVTTTDSSAVVEFRDRSTIEIGPDAVMVIDKAVFNPEESVSEKSITIVSGAFRFVSGMATQHSETTVRTPVGTLGIRGSVIVGEVAQQGDVILFAVEGKGEFSHGGVVTLVPEGGVVIATFGNGKVETLPNTPAALAKLVRQLVAKLGATTPLLKNFSSGQQGANGKEHLIPSWQQGKGQGGSGGPIVPIGAPGQSQIAALFNELAGQRGGSGGDPGDVDFLKGFVSGQLRQREFNSLAGITGVTRELSTVTGEGEVITVATSFVGHNPRYAPQVALVLVSLYPGQGQEIISAFKGVLTPQELAAVIAALNAAGGKGGLDDSPTVPLPPNIVPLSVNQ